MSINVMNAVWANSKHSGSELLMLLAIADRADDDGCAYPSVGTLAKKCRMTHRNANFVLAELRASGELVVCMRKGMNGTNLYRVSWAAGLKPPSEPRQPPTVKPASSPTEAGFMEPLKPASSDTSLIHQDSSNTEPSALVETAVAVLDGIPGGVLDLFSADDDMLASTGSTKFKADAYKPPPCPYADIATAYCELLPQLPGVTILSDVRRRAMQARWRDVCGTEKFDLAAGLDFFRWYFKRVATSDFLMGRTAPGRGSTRSFKADLDWLMTPTYFTKVVEGRYHESKSGA